MSTELEHIRSFRKQDATVDSPSRDAARRALLAHITATTQASHAAPANSAAASRRGRRWVQGGARIVGFASSAIVVVIVVAVVLALGEHTHRSVAGGATMPGRHRLIEILGVLRSPQTPGAQSFDQIGWPTAPGGGTGTRIRPDRSLIRFATVTPWGARVFLVPLTSPSSPVLARELGETVALWVQGIGWSDYSNAADIEAGLAWGPGRTVPGPGGVKESRFFEIVPDGVASVRFYLLRGFPRPGSKLRFVGSVTSVVHNNVAAFVAPAAESGGVYARWYAADGHVIKRVGDWNATKPQRQLPGRPVRGVTAGSVERAILSGKNTPRPTAASCRAPTPGERARATIGGAGSVFFSCTITLEKQSARYYVQVLPDGSFIAEQERRRREQIFGCCITRMPN